MSETQMRVDLNLSKAIEESGACKWAASFALQLFEKSPDMAIDMGCMTDEAVLQVAHMIHTLISGTPAQDAVIENVLETNRKFGLPDVTGMLSEAWRPEVMKEVRAYVASH